MIYGVVALVAVVVASRWILRRSRVSRLAIVALGASTLVAGLIVWILPIGREIDGFHGIAQNTSTAGVGFEGYLAWAAAAAIVAPLILVTTMTAQQADIWRAAARKGLLLIAVWSVGSVVMRVTDLVVSVTLKLPYSPYDSAAMAAFDLVAAVLAIWLYINLLNRALPAAVITSACAVLLVLNIARIVVGIAFAPRFAGPSPASNPVYGNNLAQQITSTFDVVLCGLAICILVIAILTGRTLPTAKAGNLIRTAGQSSDPETTRLAAEEPQTTRLAAGGVQPPSSPRIHRPRTTPPGMLAPQSPRSIGHKVTRLRVAVTKGDYSVASNRNTPSVADPYTRCALRSFPNVLRSYSHIGSYSFAGTRTA
ncbi:putative membrane protein [Mycobacterium xenopi 4042]|uniref:Putative membrane protein n=1 Tax=Mycobacterium xenopi 4042 TaxID=1299334 RepID=X8C8K5_MYCXE|nr:putative membrane protein [Mycobacterium xenopi 4042]